jgi:phenol 2-monooxygenase
MAAQYVDVLICGSGNAGLCVATWLARQGIKCTILEKRSGPLEFGHADGVQCRTVEIFESFGLSDRLIREGYHVNEVVIWGTDEETDSLVLKERTADTLPGVSHLPHLIVPQARMNAFLLDAMKEWNDQTVDYGFEVKDVRVVSREAIAGPSAGDLGNFSVAGDDAEYPVLVTAEKHGVEHLFKAKYVLASFVL